MDEDINSKLSSDRPSSEVTLLAKEQVNDETSKTIHRHPLWRQWVLPFCIHLMIFFTYSTLFLLTLSLRSKAEQSCRNLLYSPANEVLHWEVQEFHLGDGTEGPYSGYPRPELEEAWGKLLGSTSYPKRLPNAITHYFDHSDMNIRLALEDLKVFNRDQDAVALPDGSGYIGTLNIYHEIHCVKWLHTHMYQEHYFPNLDDDQREDNRLHSEHCLNQLRSTAMCHGDVGMVPYTWANDSKKPRAAAIAHQCIDFDRLAEWTEERTVDMFKPGLLVHPTLGPVYSEEETEGLMD
ncbi:hypothetical protein EG329_002639 [Mollisiaceae sp. DMI_Dod_QoI]|nr:hypothetical protein EG329_002639 [Helotiales sp. DMI_Dod_QoI]